MCSALLASFEDGFAFLSISSFSVIREIKITVKTLNLFFSADSPLHPPPFTYTPVQVSHVFFLGLLFKDLNE